MRWLWDRISRTFFGGSAYSLGQRRGSTDSTHLSGSCSIDSSTGSDQVAFDARNLPQHLAIIMDGNGRWAKRHHLPRIEGHRAGARTVRMVVEECCRLGIPYVTLFSFSTENWLRPREEVSALMRLFCQYVESERGLLLEQRIRLRAIGDRQSLPSDVQAALSRIEEDTKHFDRMELILALSYGGRGELVHAAQRIAEKVKAGLLQPDAISEDTVAAHLYAPEVPDPDMLLRTSGEYRVSNFLLWQVAYSELVISELLWPEFSKDELHRCLREYSARQRRFGRTDEERAESGGDTRHSNGASIQARASSMTVASAEDGVA